MVSRPVVLEGVCEMIWGEVGEVLSRRGVEEVVLSGVVEEV
jgi:hypothetical protein